MLTMGHGISAEDMAAILLLFSNGDLEMNIGELVERVENFQESQNGFFGVSCRDFRLAFYQLGMALQYEMGGEWPKCFLPSGDPLKEWIGPLLTTYDYVYFNDGGEYWHLLLDRRKERIPHPDFWQRRDAELTHVSDQRRSIMGEYFRNPASLRSKKASEILGMLGWQKEIFSYYFFLGKIDDDEDGPLCWDFENRIRWRYVFQGDKPVRRYP